MNGIDPSTPSDEINKMQNFLIDSDFSSDDEIYGINKDLPDLQLQPNGMQRSRSNINLY
jgi:hypothetical protein